LYTTLCTQDTTCEYRRGVHFTTRLFHHDPMVFNLPGVLVAFELLARPRIVLPSLAVKGAPHTLCVFLLYAHQNAAHRQTSAILTLPRYEELATAARYSTKITAW
jgi:hypothetical protein